jgi:hypothetical protein
MRAPADRKDVGVYSKEMHVDDGCWQIPDSSAYSSCSSDNNINLSKKIITNDK